MPEFTLCNTCNTCNNNITINTYKHLPVVKNGTNTVNGILEPFLIHCSKTFSFLFCTVRKFSRTYFNAMLTNRKALKCLGRKNLFNAFCSSLHGSNQLLCTDPMKDNFKQKCSQWN